MKNLIIRLAPLARLLILAALLFSTGGSLAIGAEPGSINGSVYCDADKSGTCDCEEHGLQDIPIQIFVSHCSGTPVQTVSTDKEGNFNFRNFQPGTYFVRVHLDYVCGGRMPTTTSCREIELAAGETVDLPPFGYSEYGQ